MPLLVWLFIVYFGFSRWLGLDLSSVAASIIVFSIWGSFEMMDLVRSSLTKHTQTPIRIRRRTGFSPFTSLYLHYYSSSLKKTSSSSMNLLTRMIKSTTFAYLIGAVELVKVGQQIIEFHNQNDFAPFVIYGLIFMLYFVICYPVSLYARTLEKKWG